MILRDPLVRLPSRGYLLDLAGLPSAPAGMVERATPLIITPLRKFRLVVKVLFFITLI
jgi:hypothetical protein